MKFYKRHPLIAIIQALFVAVFYLTPALLVTSSNFLEYLFTTSLFWIDLISGSLFFAYTVPHLLVPLVIVLPPVLILVINSVISLLENKDKF